MAYLTPESFDLGSVYFYTNRMSVDNPNVDNKIDIKEGISEFSIYEHLGKAYLTAEMIYVDDLNLFEMPGIIGTERIQFNISTPLTESESNVFTTTKNFVINGINKFNKHNEGTSVYHISLIEDHGYFNYVQKISKSYFGSGEDIIQTILKDNLKKEIDFEFNDGNPFRKSVQGDMRYNVPFLKPLDAVKAILGKITTPHGMPYLLYSSIHSDKLIFTDLETLLEKEPFNKDRAATFNPTMSYTSGNFIEQMYNISKYSITYSTAEDTLKLAQNGGLGFRYENVDTNDGTYYNQSMNLRNFIVPWLENIFDKNALGFLVDDDVFDPDPSNQNETNVSAPTLGDYNSQVYTTLKSSNFAPNKEKGINESRSFLNDVVRDATMHYLTKNVYDIEMAGMIWLATDTSRSVGGQVNIAVNQDTGLSTNQHNYSLTDDKRSGPHLIITKRHLFTPHNKKTRVSVQVSRLANRVSKVGVRVVENQSLVGRV